MFDYDNPKKKRGAKKGRRKAKRGGRKSSARRRSNPMTAMPLFENPFEAFPNPRKGAKKGRKKGARKGAKKGAAKRSHAKKGTGLKALSKRVSHLSKRVTKVETKVRSIPSLSKLKAAIKSGRKSAMKQLSSGKRRARRRK